MEHYTLNNVNCFKEFEKYTKILKVADKIFENSSKNFESQKNLENNDLNIRKLQTKCSSAVDKMFEKQKQNVFDSC